jgi:hypothetical protein
VTSDNKDIDINEVKSQVLDIEPYNPIYFDLNIMKNIDNSFLYDKVKEKLYIGKIFHTVYSDKHYNGNIKYNKITNIAHTPTKTQVPKSLDYIPIPQWTTDKPNLHVYDASQFNALKICKFLKLHNEGEDEKIILLKIIEHSVFNIYDEYISYAINVVLPKLKAFKNDPTPFSIGKIQSTKNDTGGQEILFTSDNKYGREDIKTLLSSWYKSTQDYTITTKSSIYFLGWEYLMLSKVNELKNEFIAKYEEKTDKDKVEIRWIFAEPFDFKNLISDDRFRRRYNYYFEWKEDNMQIPSDIKLPKDFYNYKKQELLYTMRLKSNYREKYGIREEIPQSELDNRLKELETELNNYSKDGVKKHNTIADKLNKKSYESAFIVEGRK